MDLRSQNGNISLGSSFSRSHCPSGTQSTCLPGGGDSLVSSQHRTGTPLPSRDTGSGLILRSHFPKVTQGQERGRLGLVPRLRSVV